MALFGQLASRAPPTHNSPILSVHMSSGKQVSKQPKLSHDGSEMRVSDKMAADSEQLKAITVDAHRRSAPTPRAPISRDTALTQMTLAQLGAQLPPADLKQTYEAYKKACNEILDAKIAKCDHLIFMNERLPGAFNGFAAHDDGSTADDRSTLTGGSAGTSGVAKTPPVKKNKTLNPNPPSSGHKPTSAHNLVDGEEGALWQAFMAVHNEIAKEISQH